MDQLDRSLDSSCILNESSRSHSSVEDVRSVTGWGADEDSFQRRLDRGKQELGQFMSRKVPSSERSGRMSLEFDRLSSAHRASSSSSRLGRLSGEALSEVDLLMRPVSARGTVSKTSDGGSRSRAHINASLELEKMGERVVSLQERNNELVHALMDRHADVEQMKETLTERETQDETTILELRRENRVLTKNKQQVLELFERSIERIRSQEETIQDLEGENDILRDEVRRTKERHTAAHNLNERLQELIESVQEQLEKTEQEAEQRTQGVSRLYREELARLEGDCAALQQKLVEAGKKTVDEEDKDTSYQKKLQELESQAKEDSSELKSMKSLVERQSIELSFKDDEITKLKENIDTMGAESAASTTESEQTISKLNTELEDLRAEVAKKTAKCSEAEKIKTQMEVRLQTIARSAAELGTELRETKQVVEKFGRTETEVAAKLQKLESSVKSANEDVHILTSQVADRDQILARTLQRMMRLAEQAAELGGAADWDTELKNLRQQLGVLSARELAASAKKAASEASTDASNPADSEQSTSESFDSASGFPQAVIFEGEEGTMIATKAMQMGRKRRREAGDDDMELASNKAKQQAGNKGWFGILFGASSSK